MTCLDLIPYKLRDDPLFKEVCELLDAIADIDREHIEPIVEKYIQVLKSLSTGTEQTELTVQKEVFYQRIINEFGFDYINDFFVVKRSSEDTGETEAGGIRRKTRSIATITFLSALFQTLKGTKNGLESLLRIVGFDEVIITEWWEKEQGSSEPFTFDLRLALSGSTIKETRVITDLIRRYVYAKLSKIELELVSIRLVAKATGYTEQTYETAPIILGV